MTKLWDVIGAPITGSNPPCTGVVARFDGVNVSVTYDDLGFAGVVDALRQVADIFQRRVDVEAAKPEGSKKPKGNKRRTGILA